MELISWHPDLSRECPDRSLSISLKVSVECSVCRMIYKIATDRYVLEGEIPCRTIRDVLDRKVDDAVAPAPCPDCGVVQTFSEHDRERLRGQVEKLITDEWVRSQYRRVAA